MLMRNFAVVVLCFGFLNLTACAPKVGSEEWCEAMQEQPSGEWTANQAADYANHCVLKKLK